MSATIPKATGMRVAGACGRAHDSMHASRCSAQSLRSSGQAQWSARPALCVMPAFSARGIRPLCLLGRRAAHNVTRRCLWGEQIQGRSDLPHAMYPSQVNCLSCPVYKRLFSIAAASGRGTVAVLLVGGAIARQCRVSNDAITDAKQASRHHFHRARLGTEHVDALVRDALHCQGFDRLCSPGARDGDQDPADPIPWPTQKATAEA